MAESPGGDLLAVASSSFEGHVTLIDKNQWSVVASLSLGSIGNGLTDLLFSPDASRLYALSFNGISIIEVDGTNSSVLWQGIIDPVFGIGFGGKFTLSPDGSKLYVGLWPLFQQFVDHHMRIIDTATFETVATIELPVINTIWPGQHPSASFMHGGPAHFIWSGDGSRLRLFSLNGDTHVLDAVTNEVVASDATYFWAPTFVTPLPAADPESTEQRFLLASYNNDNDGLAVLTIDEKSITVTPALVDFGYVQTGQASQPEIVTITNTGIAPVTISSISEPGTGFVRDGGTCVPSPFSPEITLQPGSACTLEYVFAPPSAGDFNTIVSIESDAASGTDTVLLTGIGVSQSEDGIFTDRFQ